MTPPSYGDTTAEYVALHSSAAVIEGRFDALRVHGPDAVAFLDSILSQDIGQMSDGAVSRSLLLQPQGKLTATLWVLKGSDEVYLLADPGYGDVAAAQLNRFMLRVKVSITPIEGDIVTVVGPRARDEVNARGLDPGPGWSVTDDVLVADVPLHPAIGRFVVIGAVDWSSLPRAGTVAADALRVELGEPVMGVDIDEKTIPQESGLVDESVSFTKGCYLGQELVARIDTRGRVNRRLVAVKMEENVVPPPGSDVVAAEKVVGVLTSPTESLELRAPVGLSLIRREVGDGDEVVVRWENGSGRARVLAVPTGVFTDS